MLSKTPKRRIVSIPFNVLLYMSWRNLTTKKLRSILTIAGVVIGIGAIFFLLSLGLGLRDLVKKEVIGNKSIRLIDVSSPNSRIVKLDENNMHKLRGLSQVEKIGISYSLAGNAKFDGSETDVIAYGIDMPYQELTDFQITNGRLINDSDTKAVFVNQAFADAVGVRDSNSLIKKSLELNIPIKSINPETGKDMNEVYEIVGIISSGSGSEIYLPASSLTQYGLTTYSQVKLIAKQSAQISDLRKQIESLGLETSSPIDTIDQINQIFKYFNLMLVGFGAIGMIVAILGMFNTLTISLLERTREIGLLVALGGRNKDMRMLFILEAMFISTIGSMIGIFAAVVTGKLVNLLMNNMAAGRGVTENFSIFSAPLWLILTMIGFMMSVGMLVVYLPARRAEKINPIEALRRE